MRSFPSSYYITTAIDYVNGKPHIGHALEKVQADALARYQRLLGKDVFFATGVDEHGAKIVRAAGQAGSAVQEFVDSNTSVFRAMADMLNVSYSAFVRTSDKKAHWGSVVKLWNVLLENGDMYKKQYQGLYCVGHEAFVTSKDLNSNGVCELHNAKPDVVEEENYFFRLSSYTDAIQQAIESNELMIYPTERKNEVLSLLSQGLEDVSFSRPRKDLQWGIPVPDDDTQTMYVWADALTNYISVLGYEHNSDQFQQYWPADVHIIGKDILRFHSAIWIGMLLSANIPLPKCIVAHGFVSVDGVKMSKSLGNVVDPLALVEKYGADPVRYFLLAEISSTQDGDFSYEKLETRCNADLAFGFGNFTSRISSLGEQHYKGAFDNMPTKQCRTVVAEHTQIYHRSMEQFSINEAIASVRSLMRWGDKRINDIRLWELPTQDRERFQKEMIDMTYLLYSIAWLLLPIIPDSAEEMMRRCGVSVESEPQSFTLQKGEPLFQHLP